MHFQKVISLFVLAVVSACVSTTNVEAPDQVEPSSSFLAVVTCVVTTPSTECYGYMGVLLPNEWELADSLTYIGGTPGLPPNTGDMIFGGYGLPYQYVGYQYPAGPLHYWASYISDSAYACDSLDIYEITVRIHADSVLGFYDIAFLGFAQGYAGWYSSSCPCTTTVEVVELNLEQSTWGSIKSDFSIQ